MASGCRNEISTLEEQIVFLQKIQRLFEEGDFSATCIDSEYLLLKQDLRFQVVL